MTDPVADLLTRIRNANSIGAKSTEVPYSELKKNVLRVLKEQGFILDYFPELRNEAGEKVEAGEGSGRKQAVLKIDLKYGPDGEKVIRSIAKSAEEQVREISLLQSHLHDDVAGFVYKRLKRRPMILPVVVEV